MKEYLWNESYAASVWKKKHFFSNDVYYGKISQDFFFSRFVFSLQFFFFSKIFLKWVYCTFESCFSLIMASVSQLKVKTIKYIILIVLAGCFIINIPYHLNNLFEYTITLIMNIINT